jgi:hypothetical protein
MKSDESKEGLQTFFNFNAGVASWLEERIDKHRAKNDRHFDNTVLGNPLPAIGSLIVVLATGFIGRVEQGLRIPFALACGGTKLFAKIARYPLDPALKP